MATTDNNAANDRLPKELWVFVFSYLGGGCGTVNLKHENENPPKSERNTIDIEEVRKIDQVLPLVLIFVQSIVIA